MFAPSVGARNEVGKFCTGRYGATSRQSVTQLHEATEEREEEGEIKSEGENGREVPFVRQHRNNSHSMNEDRVSQTDMQKFSTNKAICTDCTNFQLVILRCVDF